MRDRFPLIALILATLVVVIGVFVSRTAKRGGFAETLSTYRSEPDGARALYLLAQAEGLDVRRRTLDLTSIDHSGVLVLLGVEGDKPPPERKADSKDTNVLPQGFLVDWLDRDERKEVVRFVEDGGRLVYVFGSPQRLAEAFDLTYTPETTVTERELVPDVPSPLTSGTEQLLARVSGFVNRTGGALTLLMDPHADGEAVAVVFDRGKGRVLAISVPDLATNRALGRGDNATFWVSALSALAHGDPVEFDEYHHGFSESRSFAAWASRYGLQFALLQLLAALVALAASTRRFGRPLPLRDSARLVGADYLVAMARIYKQGGHRQHVTRRILEGLLQFLSGRFGVSGRATPASVGAALDRQGQADLAKGLADLATDVATGASSDGEVLRIARRAARLRAKAEPRQRRRSRAALRA